ncbi:unnamed protein product [Hymenolepis diminuta]|uniref:Uncharacterized protein n=1 Tax=Hymenolepis diminuta TaxID=6216 RepID=A0A564Z4R2_HYMDI|nr:unnamed protein product [Hymenolepis diminuta]
MLWRVLTQVTHKAIFVFHTRTHACRLPAPTLHLLSSSARSPLSLPLSLTSFKLVVTSLNAFWSNQLLVFALQLSLALTRTVANW